ncbi:hypothetical protein RhiirA1_402853 [Rhizophagus irregularis]|uniref:NrS-1 polymerase-like helicase domain-containing protein n=1 Tax=Rhizophagus irregularis TaxID=588596 RepID=A0A2N0QWW9_9GLOM|nr:hypothetical protein RhiirA1_402853 [Rhizophagus irregularis]
MIRPPNDDSRVIDSPLLVVPESEVNRCLKKNNDTNNEITQADFDFVESLRGGNGIEGYTLSFPSDNIPDLFPLTRNSPSHCPICDQEHESDNGYILRNKKIYRFYCHRANHEREPGTRNPSVKLTISETALQQEQKLPSPIKLDQSRISDPNDRFVWEDLIDMCTSGRKFSRNEIYDAIQATVTCIQTTSRLWVLKTEDTNGGLYFDMAPKLDLAKYEVNLVELGGEPVKLINLIDRAVTKGLILYHNINFLPYPLNTPAYDTKFFNLFIGFLAKPAPEINKEIMDPILWHVKNVICSGDERLNEYIWNWWAYLVQKPEKKPRTILVLKFTLQQCGKNIITDFIGDKVLGSHLHFATSDLEKILGHFNSAIQTRKLIVMNETGMSSGEWHRFNGHLKSLITERMVAIERKGLETVRINDYAGGNIPYFDRLGEILDHPDVPGVVMSYLLSRNLTNWSPGKIPTTKMKIETMRRQLPNPIRFIIDYILPWPENCINRFSCKKVYQDYLEWCECNGEKPLAKKDAGTKFSLISIDRTRSRDNGVRVYQYILDCPKIVAKLRESGLGDMEEFSDISQDDLPENEITDIPIFNVPKTVLERPTIPQKITPPQPEENLPPRGKKADKQDNSTQVLFNYVAEQAELPGASTSRTSETSKPPEPVIDKPEVNKLSKTNEPISKNTNTPPKETTSKLPDSSKPINEVSSAILLSRAQREERLRKKAVELGENPDAFVTITEKNRLDSIAFRDRMETDSRICDWAIETEEDPKEYMDMKVRERLIGEEIIRRSLEDDGVTSSWLDTDEKWKKTSSTDPRGLEAEVNISLVSENAPEGETIREMAQRIVWDNLSERNVKAISRTLAETASDPIIASSRLSRLRRELRTLNAPEKIISATKIPEITRASNKIQQERTEQRKNEGLHYPDHFSLESVKEWLDLYVVSNTSDKQALADVMIMLCIRPAEIKNLRIANGGVTGYAKNRG